MDNFINYIRTHSFEILISVGILLIIISIILLSSSQTTAGIVLMVLGIILCVPYPLKLWLTTAVVPFPPAPQP